MFVTKVGDCNDVNWVDKYKWNNSGVAHIWYNVTLNLYHYVDEASQIDIMGYQVIEEAEEALDIYTVSL